MSNNVEQIFTEFESLRREVKDLRKENGVLKELNRKLTVENEHLKAEIKELQSKMNQDSQNSSRPPSSDPLWKRAMRPSTSKGKNRKPGGQNGHKGHKLRKFEKVDHHVVHELSTCPECGCGDLIFEGKVNRQVIDIPEPKVEVTEHEIWKYTCSGCHSKVEGGRELGLNQEAQYGNRLKSLVSYLNVYQIVPYKRLTELINHLYGIQISQGTISNFNKELQSKLQGFKKATISKFQNEVPVLHSDETGCMVNKDLHWVHVYCTALTTFLFGHEKRGREAMDAIDILSQTEAIVMHDRYGSYFTYDTFDHGLCNAHILRELRAIKD